MIHERGRKRTWLLLITRLLVLAGLIAGFVYILFFSRLLVVAHIDCVVQQYDSQQKMCSDDVLAELNRYMGINIFFLQPRNIEQRLLKADKMIEKVTVSKKVPRIVMVNLKQRIPFMQIFPAINSPTSAVVDIHGIVVEHWEKDASIQALYWDHIVDYSIGQEVPELVVTAMTIVSSVRELFGSPQIFIVSGNDLIAQSGNTLSVTFSLENDVATQIRALQVLINQARIEGVAYKTVDLRFEHPIVTR